MEKDKRISKKLAALATGALAISAAGANANGVDLFEVNDLGTAGELRSQLLTESPSGFVSNSEVELKCGEGKDGEAKCGEGKAEKAEEKKSEAKEDKKAEKKEEKATEGKATEHKCGEGKCGEGKCGEH
tara:strand:+ start:8585 stop:8971 length:387 start_codon:yes stop_codon:yes gene_type:complete